MTKAQKYLEALKIGLYETYNQGIGNVFNDLNTTMHQRPIDIINN